MLTAVIALAAVAVLTVVLFALGGKARRDVGAQPRPAPAPAQPAAPPPDACPPVIGANLSLRDRLAQLLMVGVTEAADARSVVDAQHVSGIFIGSWTDRSMLTDGSLRALTAAGGPFPLAVSVDEEGGRVRRLSSLIGSQPTPPSEAAHRSPD